MRVEAEISYPAGVPAVVTMLADPAFVRAKARAVGALDEQVDVEGDGTGAFTVTIRLTMPTDQVPAAFRSFVGQRLDVRQVEAWAAPAPGDDGRRGTVSVEVPGTPVKLTGTVALRPAAEGRTTQRYEGDLSVSVPLFGRQIEQAIEQAVLAGLAAEESVAADWLRPDH